MELPQLEVNFSHLGLVYVDRVFGHGIDRRLILVIGRELHGAGHSQIGITSQVAMGDHGMPDMVVVPQREAISSGVKGIAVLGIPGYWLQPGWIRSKAEISPQAGDVDRSDLGVIWKVKWLAGLAEAFGIAPGRSHFGIGSVDPIVDAVEKPVDSELRVIGIEAREEHASFVGTQVSIFIGQVVDVGCGGYQDAVSPRHQAGGEGEIFGIDAAPGKSALAVGLLQDDYPPLGIRLHGIVSHLQNEQASLSVERHGHRVADQGLGGDKLDAEALR